MSWTRERIAALKTAEVEQLRSNAHARANAEVAALCDEVLSTRPARPPRGRAPRQRELDGRQLVSRKKAFEMRGVTLRNSRWSWGGIRPTDNTVVFSIWAQEVETANGFSRYMLWGPNRGRKRPWSETPGGRERLEHCRLAVQSGEGEGVLIYGQQRGVDLPIEEASKVSGADPHKVLRFRVTAEGEEFWATWPAVTP